MVSTVLASSSPIRPACASCRPALPVPPADRRDGQPEGPHARLSARGRR